MESIKDALCYPYYYIWAVAIPLVVGLGLYFAKPKQVMKVVNNNNVIDGQMFFKWLLGISAVGWVALYFFAQSQQSVTQYCISRRLMV